MSTPKASLTTSQGVSAVIAGIVGHFLFSLAWFTLILGVLGLVARGLVFGLIDSAVRQIELTGDAGAGILGTIEALRGALGTITLVLIISSAVSVIVAFLVSGIIMRIGKVRKPFGTTFAAMVIVGILDLGLFWLYLFIGLGASDETGFIPTYPIVFVIGTVVIGALVWLWMAHLRRGPLSEAATADAVVADVTGENRVVAAAPDSPQPSPPPLASAEPTAAEAPVVDPEAPPASDEPRPAQS
jgi:hypothetical protein